MITTLEEALEKIKELEKEVEELKEEIEILRNRNLGGRKKHDKAWMASYREFVVDYEAGKKITEIVNENDFSRRTAYRYLAYYKEFQKMLEQREHEKPIEPEEPDLDF